MALKTPMAELRRMDSPGGALLSDFFDESWHDRLRHVAERELRVDAHFQAADRPRILRPLVQCDAAGVRRAWDRPPGVGATGWRGSDRLHTQFETRTDYHLRDGSSTSGCRIPKRAVRCWSLRQRPCSASHKPPARLRRHVYQVVHTARRRDVDTFLSSGLGARTVRRRAHFGRARW